MVSYPETLNKIYYWFIFFSSSGFLASVSYFFAQQFNYDVIIKTCQIISFFPNGKSCVFLSLPAFLILSLCFALPFHFLLFSFLLFFFFYTFLFFCFSVFTAILYLFSHFLLKFVCSFLPAFFVLFSLFPLSVPPSSSVDLITRPNIFFYCLCWYR